MSLDVYLRGQLIGGLFRAGEDGYSFAYRPEAVEQGDPGTVLLSHTMPLRAEPYSPAVSRAYIEGLLPQGGRRRAIARELEIHPDDGFALIAEMGGDCLGAVTFLSEGETVEPREIGDVEWLTDYELEAVLEPRPSPLFEAERPRRMRFALPGDRHKLALVYDEENDRWAWPEPGLPSTHIVKPEAPDRPGIVANEHACTLAYRELGLPVAHTSIATIAEHTCLVSKRFDRWGEGPRVERLHQESFTQVLGIAPEDAEGRLAPGVPMLSEVSNVLRAIGEGAAVETLMKTVFCDLMVGCAELRADNVALLFGPDGPMPAPFYGIASTEIYGESRPRPTVIGDAPPAPLLIDIRYATDLCGLEFQSTLIESVELMGRLCSALGSQAEQAMDEGWYRRAIDDALQLAMNRAKRFAEEMIYLKPPGAEPPPRP
jgi:serine/threonine-protein kinase HipA